jgi:hypothetical protein
MVTLPKAICRFNAIPQISMSLFTEIEKSTLNLIWKPERA